MQPSDFQGLSVYTHVKLDYYACKTSISGDTLPYIGMINIVFKDRRCIRAKFCQYKSWVKNVLHC